MPTRRTLLIAPCAFVGLVALSRRHDRPLPDPRRNGAGGRIRIVLIADNGARETVEVNKIEKPDAELQRELSPDENTKTRKKGTVRAFTGRYWNNHEDGLYK